MNAVHNERMAAVMQALARQGKADCELIPGPFAGSAPQLTLRLPDGRTGSVLPDADVGALYELVLHESAGDKLLDKLTLQGVLDAVAAAVTA